MTNEKLKMAKIRMNLRTELFIFFLFSCVIVVVCDITTNASYKCILTSVESINDESGSFLYHIIIIHFLCKKFDFMISKLEGIPD